MNYINEEEAMAMLREAGYEPRMDEKLRGVLEVQPNRILRTHYTDGGFEFCREEVEMICKGRK